MKIETQLRITLSKPFLSWREKTGDTLCDLVDGENFRKDDVVKLMLADLREQRRGLRADRVVGK